MVQESQLQNKSQLNLQICCFVSPVHKTVSGSVWPAVLPFWGNIGKYPEMKCTHNILRVNLTQKRQIWTLIHPTCIYWVRKEPLEGALDILLTGDWVSLTCNTIKSKILTSTCRLFSAIQAFYCDIYIWPFHLNSVKTWKFRSTQNIYWVNLTPESGSIIHKCWKWNQSHLTFLTPFGNMLVRYVSLGNTKLITGQCDPRC